MYSYRLSPFLSLWEITKNTARTLREHREIKKLKGGKKNISTSFEVSCIIFIKSKLSTLVSLIYTECINLNLTISCFLKIAKVK